jgi:hypothetical protein
MIDLKFKLMTKIVTFSMFLHIFKRKLINVNGMHLCMNLSVSIYVHLYT